MASAAACLPWAAEGVSRGSAVPGPRPGASRPVPRSTVAGGDDEKPCAACGRRIVWRARWARVWADVRYCSSACRAARVRPRDRRLEQAITTLLAERAAGASICPSEAARAVDPIGWRAMMAPARAAARRLVHAGVCEITQRGRRVDPSAAAGPIRVRLARAAG